MRGPAPDAARLSELHAFRAQALQYIQAAAGEEGVDAALVQRASRVVAGADPVRLELIRSLAAEMDEMSPQDRLRVISHGVCDVEIMGADIGFGFICNPILELYDEFFGYPDFLGIPGTGKRGMFNKVDDIVDKVKDLPGKVGDVYDKVKDLPGKVGDVYDKVKDLPGKVDGITTSALSVQLTNSYNALITHGNAQTNSLTSAVAATGLALSNQLTSSTTQLTNKVAAEANEQRALDLRLQIELNLQAGEGKALVMFQLPRIQGGYLELVRDTVNDAITSMLAAGQSINQAQKYFIDAQSAISQGRYKDAFKFLQTAYQNVAK